MLFVWRRGFFSSASVSAQDKAKEAQETAGNPFAPTSSAGGTPTDNKTDESKCFTAVTVNAPHHKVVQQQQ